MKLQEIHDRNLTISFDKLSDDRQLAIEIQTILSTWGLYPGSQWIDGDFGSKSLAALKSFCQLKNLNNLTIKVLDKTLSEALLDPNVATLRLETAKNNKKIFDIFLQSEKGFTESKLRIRDWQIQNSSFQPEINLFPNRLTQKPDNVQIVSFGKQVTLSNPTRTVEFSSYPKLSSIPTLDTNSLNFLNADIQEACVCIGSFVDGEIQVRWLGKNALNSVQFWSATKIIALLNAISQVNTNDINCDIDNCIVRNSGSESGISFHELAIDLISYRNPSRTSNALGAMFKRFGTHAGLDRWLKQITGNNKLSFKGRYGENAFFNHPELYDRAQNKIVLQSPLEDSRGDNLVSAYDLTRLVSMLGWHYHLPSHARLPGAQWYSLESLVRAMGNDRARYIDLAIERLGLRNVIKDTVIISKVGWGNSDSRNRYELTYTALIQFVDRRENPAKLRTLAMTLRAAKALNPRDLNREATELDARMAAEVTEILRRVVTEELA